MASLKFYLKKSKGVRSSIFFRLNYGAFEIVNGKKKYLPLQYHTDESINSVFWNSKAGKAKETSKFKEYPEFNACLENVRSTVLSLLRRLKNDEVLINNDVLRDELDLIYRKDRNKTSLDLDLLLFAENFKESTNIATTTKKSYARVISDLREYEQEKGTKLTFDKIDIDFHDSFIKYLQSKKYAPNTIGTRIKVIKTIMRASHERGLHNNTDYQKRAFSKPKEETTSVYLNESELTQLYNVDLSNNKKLDSVRDWLIIAAYTGLRFSDLLRLTREDFGSDEIEIKTQKTDTTVNIPLHTYVKQIFEKHNFVLPQLISNQKFNQYVKDVAKCAKIDDSIIVEENKGGVKTRRAVAKHDLISAHTARRSFATNAFIAGVPAIQIMKMTGHKTEKAFMTYIKISGKENAKKLQLHPFFNKMIIR